MDNERGKLIGYCPLFDHDHTFADYENVYSQTTEMRKTLKEAAEEAQAELQLDLSDLFVMDKPELLDESSGRKCWRERIG